MGPDAAPLVLKANEDWVNPPLPGGWMVSAQKEVYTSEQLFNWSNWISPPRGWPIAFTHFPPMKEFIGKKLKGRHVRLTEPACVPPSHRPACRLGPRTPSGARAFTPDSCSNAGITLSRSAWST